MAAVPEDAVVVEAHAPGRVVLIGDHTDYADGLSVTMAIDLGTRVTGVRRGRRVQLESAALPGTVEFVVGTGDDMDRRGPSWGAYAEGVARAMSLGVGFAGRVESTLPVGSGLSSSAALEIALLLAFGFEGPPEELASLGQRSEHLAVGVPCGALDQMSIVHGREGAVLVLDLESHSVRHRPLPSDLEVLVIHSGLTRALEGSAYAQRRAEVEAAAAMIGPLPGASEVDIASLDDPVLRRRARHVATECRRVEAFEAALLAADSTGLGELMVESHRSLRDDMEVSTPELDDLVQGLLRRPGVLGARLTGAGFGGCVVALAQTGAIPDPDSITGRGWTVRPSDGARAHLGATGSLPGRNLRR